MYCKNMSLLWRHCSATLLAGHGTPPICPVQQSRFATKRCSFHNKPINKGSREITPPARATADESSSDLLCRSAVVREPWRIPRFRMATQKASRQVSCRASSSVAADERAQHNTQQLAKFSDPNLVKLFTQPLPADIEQKLKAIVDAVPGLDSESRIIDVGSGTGCLIPHLNDRGVTDILAVDLSPIMLQELQRRFPNPGTLGNTTGVRTWQGDVLDLPAYMGPVDAFFFNAVFGNLHNPYEALLKAALMLRPGAHVVISHPMGRSWHEGLHASEPDVVPHHLPDKQSLSQLISGLPLELEQFRDEPDLYLAVLQVPPRYHFPHAPVILEGPVVSGMGRGSKQMGVPTANIDPSGLQSTLQGLPQGVYFGWAQLVPPPGSPEVDGNVHKMVLNIGRRPTVNKGLDVTVEAHILHKFAAEDFRGQTLKVWAIGYIRPEIRFNGIQALISRIKADIGIAKNQLDDPVAKTILNDLGQ